MMKKSPFLILLALLIFSSCKRQNPEDYNALIAEARDLFEGGDYKGSGKKYNAAFEIPDNSDTLIHHYEAARTWALAGEKERAFAQLNEISREGQYADLGEISTDNSLNSLRTDKRWINILNRVSENKKKADAKFSEVASVLDIVHRDDQLYRQELDEIQEKYGHDSEEVRAHWELIQSQDSINLTKVEKVLEEHGWLGWEIIGRTANSALFLVIQHANLETQQEYLPMLREAVNKGDAAPYDLALLEDRIALRQGKKQIYGSQIGRDQETGEYYVSPLVDPDNVDRRRAGVGLEPIEDYISNWGLTWDPEAYKKILPKLEAKEKITG